MTVIGSGLLSTALTIIFTNLDLSICKGALASIHSLKAGGRRVNARSRCILQNQFTDISRLPTLSKTVVFVNRLKFPDVKSLKIHYTVLGVLGGVRSSGLINTNFLASTLHVEVAFLQ